MKWGFLVVLLFWLSHSSAVKSAATPKSRTQLSKKELTLALKESRGTSSTAFPDQSPPLSVAAILVPRRLPLRGLIRSLCFGWILFSLLQCLKTAGVPHIQTIWSLVHENGSAMPANYRPSTADIHLSQLIASATNEIVPPISLPSGGPLLGLLFSTFTYIGSTVLFPRWFTAAKVFLDYQKVSVAGASGNLVKSLSKAAVLVHIEDKDLQQQVASDNDRDDRSRSMVICPLQWSTTKEKKKTMRKGYTNTTVTERQFCHPFPNYFNLNQCRFYFDTRTGSCTDGGPTLQSAPLCDLRQLVATGLTSAQRKIAQERYHPYNRPTLASPTISEAFAARISSPLVVVQIVGRLLSCLEEGRRSAFNAVFTLAQHYWNARQAIVSARQMAQEVQANVRDTSSLPVLVLREDTTNQRQWISTSAGELVPGDVFVLMQESGADSSLLIPVDALLLGGQTLANEAVLTGESVPQNKIPIDFDEQLQEDLETKLDVHEHRNSILFAGTTMVHCSSQATQMSIGGFSIPAHNQSSSVICLALLTGTYSSKGQLLRTLKSTTHVGAISNAQSEKDAMRLIASLSVFAMASCISIFIPRGLGGGNAKPVPVFRRIIQCTRIAIASIPSDLPLALSAVARSCSLQLRSEADVICSEAGSLLTAAYIDTVVFDKTGTITADTQSVSKLVSKLEGQNSSSVSDSFQKFQLAGCHSLVHLKTHHAAQTQDVVGQIVGDPLDQAALQYSGWKYNATEGYYSSQGLSDSASPCDFVRLWQIKSFPFDPNKRLSSAVVMAQSVDGGLRLFSLTKGSPDTVRDLYAQKCDPSFINSFDQQMKRLESQGYRSIAMGTMDLSNSPLATELFPEGLTTDNIELVNQKGSSLHRGVIESGGLDFTGFACFDASIRPSSKRVIAELDAGEIKSIMLTGDAIDAAITVAVKVGMIKKRQVAILEAINGPSGESKLQFRFVQGRESKKASTRQAISETKAFSASSVQDIFKRQRAGKIAIAATGQALEVVFENTAADKDMRGVAENLFRLSVIARATPKQKNSVISCLKNTCQKKVMMCGDGVNDVAAMKSADVAVALLSGFGDEKEVLDGKDMDDERRKKKAQSQLLGSNRATNASSRNVKGQESRQRIARQIEEAQAAIKQQAADRVGSTPESPDVKYGVEDVKDMISATMGVMKSERRREKSLNKGGGDAARILAGERRNVTASEVDAEPLAEIKPGEASLVASFSCLHPSIDGVDSVLRAGVATAACALATQEMIALHSLMACYHLATLYRDGFRYGKNMWPVEMFMYSMVDNARYAASCSSRPRLPQSRMARTPESMFHPSSIFGTAAQAAIHLGTMAVGVNYARQLESVSSLVNGLSIQLIQGSRPPKISQILSALAMTSAGSDVDDVDRPTGLFRRPPFRPNYETNMVFILSTLQSAVSCLVNHKGRPFYQSISESRQLCFASILTGFLVVAWIGESFPLLNTFLELKPLPTRMSKIIFLGIAVFNVTACIGCRSLANMFSDHVNCVNTSKVATKTSDHELAADLEERLLLEESLQNRKGSVMALVVLIYLAVEMISKSK